MLNSDPHVLCTVVSAANGEGDDRVYNSVSDYYGKQLASSKDLKTNACTAGGKPHDMVLDALKKYATLIFDHKGPPAHTY